MAVRGVRSLISGLEAIRNGNVIGGYQATAGGDVRGRTVGGPLRRQRIAEVCERPQITGVLR